MKQFLRSSMLLLACCVLGSVAACGSDDAGKNDPPVEELPNVPTATAEDVFTGVSSAVCARVFECKDTFPLGEGTFNQVFGETEKDCKLVLVQYLNIDDVFDQIDAGEIIYHGDKGYTCQEEIDTTLSTLTCQDLWSQAMSDPTSLISEGSCGSMLEGTLAAGETCTTQFQCISQECNNGTCG